jgi:hypothetical protein
MMRKNFLFSQVAAMILLAVIMTAAPRAFAQEGFRGFIWGVTPSDVRTFETAAFYKEEGGSLYFLERLSRNDFRRLIRYDFRDGGLWRASYEYQEYTHPNSHAALERYEDMVRELSKTYGEPAEDEFLWRDRLYRNHPNLWGRALLSGDLRRRTVWQTEETRVTAQIHMTNPYFFLGYTAEMAKAGADKAPDFSYSKLNN